MQAAVQTVDLEVEESLCHTGADPSSCPSAAVEPMESITYGCNDYVAAVYDGAWYPGMVIREEDRDGEVQVNFMARASTKIKGWKWPERKHQLFIPNSSVLRNISEPVPTGKAKRVFSLCELDVEKVNLLMESKLIN